MVNLVRVKALLAVGSRGFLMLHYLPYALVIALWIYAFVDCLGTPEPLVRGLPKVLWVVVIALLGPILLGPLAWLALGRRRGPAAGGSTPSQWHAAHRADRPRGNAGLTMQEPPPGWVAPDDNPEFLRSLDELNRNRRRDGLPPEGE